MAKIIISVLCLLFILSLPASAQVSHVSINQSLSKLGDYPQLKLNIVSSHKTMNKLQFIVRQSSGDERLLVEQLNGFMLKLTGMDDVVDPDATLVVKEYRRSRWREVKALKLFGGEPVPASAPSGKNHPVAPGSQAVKTPEADKPLQGLRLSEASVVVTRVEDCTIVFSGDETLWRIASRQSLKWGLSTYGAMLAIFESNPQAFNNHNINGLKAGAKLDCPEINTLERYADKSAAKAQFESMAKR